MVLRRINTQVFHRRLYARQLETVTLLKRRNDQKEGSVVALKLFECRRGNITKQGEAIQFDYTAEHYVQWLIPCTELRRVGVNYLNVLDRIVDQFNHWWQPESPQPITLAIFDNYYVVDCVRIDPPPGLLTGPAVVASGGGGICATPALIHSCASNSMYLGNGM